MSRFIRLSGFQSSLICTLAVLVASGCGGHQSVETPVSSLLPLVGSSADINSIRGRKIKQLMVVVFEEGITEEQWKVVFDQTKNMNEFQKKSEALTPHVVALGEEVPKPFPASIARSYGCLPSTSSENAMLSGAEELEEVSFCLNSVRDQVNADYMDTILSLFQRTPYFMLWERSSNCRFSDDARPYIQCKPDPAAPTFFSGGYPELAEPVHLSAPRSDEKLKTEAFSIRLRSKPEDNQRLGQFELELRLRPDVTPEGIILRGDLHVKEGSTLIWNGKPARYFPIGYAELKLE